MDKNHLRLEFAMLFMNADRKPEHRCLNDVPPLTIWGTRIGDIILEFWPKQYQNADKQTGKGYFVSDPSYPSIFLLRPINPCQVLLNAVLDQFLERNFVQRSFTLTCPRL
jgi:hypothetical protein